MSLITRSFPFFAAANAVPLINPGDYSGKLWLKADAGVTESGGLVSSWLDQSGSGWDATAAGALRPSYVTGVQNSLPAIRCASATRCLQIASFAIKSYFWAMIVSNCTHPTDFFMEHSANVGSNQGFYLYGYGWFMMYVNRASTTKARATPDGFMSGSWNYTIFSYAGAGISAWKNGSAVSEVSDDAVNTGDTTVTDTLYIFSRAASTLATVGDLGEIFLKEGSLDDATRSSFQTYAASRWAI